MLHKNMHLIDKYGIAPYEEFIKNGLNQLPIFLSFSLHFDNPAS